MINRFANMQILEEISQAAQLPMKFIHVIRNPLYNIATILLHSLNSPDTVGEEGVKVRRDFLIINSRS